MIQRRACLVLLLLILVVANSLFAQSSEEWFLGTPIQDIRFTNLQRVPVNELNSVVAPFIGMQFTEPVFQDIQRRLYALDYFDFLLPTPIPVDDTFSAVILEFEVLERPVLGQIQFQGMRRLRESQLRNQILSSLGDVYSLPRIRADRESILAFYRERGYPQAQVEFEVTEMPTGDKLVLFRIVEGPQTTVRSIQFQGNSFGTPSALRSAIKTREQGLFNSGIFQASQLEADVEAIITYYEENGFIDAQVLDVQTIFELSGDGNQSSVTLTFVIQEGQRWTFGGIEFEGNQIFSDERLARNVTIRPGDVLNAVRLRTNIQQVLDVYLQNGYFNNEFDFQEERDPNLLSVNYRILITERPRSYIENVIIRGNEKTLDQVIRRELPFGPGDVFSASRIREGLLNIFNLQYFEGVPLVETPQGTEPELRDVIITVEERRTMDVRGGFSVGGEGFPLALIASLSDINFLGRGQNFGVQLNLSSLTQSITANFSDNFLFGNRIGGGVNLTLERNVRQRVPQDILGPVFFGLTEENFIPDPFTTREEYLAAGGLSGIPNEYLMEYLEYRLGLGFNVSIRRRIPIGWLGLGSSIRTSLNFIDYDASLYRPASQTVRNNLGTFTLINQLGLSASLDSRDVFFNPSSGSLLSQNFLFTGGFLFGSRHFIRTDTTAQTFFTLFHTGDEPIGNFRIVLALNSSLSVLLPQFWTQEGTDSFQAESNLLFTNGMNIARGWSPKPNLQGVWNNWIELRMPIVESILWYDSYIEAVRIAENRDNLFNFSRDSDWLFGIGTGLRLAIPQLPISLYLAKRFTFDENGSIKWQDGNLFPGQPGEGKGIDLIFAINLFN
jgi:outer membrane protein insertion porin family